MSNLAQKNLLHSTCQSKISKDKNCSTALTFIRHFATKNFNILSQKSVFLIKISRYEYSG